MTARGRRANRFLLVIAWFTVFPPRAFAYLDPGTGSLIIQSVIAAIAAVGVAVRLYWSRIRSWFQRPEEGDPVSRDGPNDTP